MLAIQSSIVLRLILTVFTADKKGDFTKEKGSHTWASTFSEGQH